MAFLAYWIYRRERLCDGDEGANIGCPNAAEECEGNYIRTERCSDCWLTKFDSAMDTPPGIVLRRAMRKKAAMKAGVQHGAGDLGADEYSALILLEAEAQKNETEREEERRRRNAR